jgi:hypothetical protein
MVAFLDLAVVALATHGELETATVAVVVVAFLGTGAGAL